VKTLVLGGGVFVGKHMVQALLAAGHEVAMLNRGQTTAAIPAGVEHLRADRTDAAQLAAVLAGRDWDAIYDVSGFVMVAGGADISVLLDLVEGHVGHYVYVSSIMGYDQSLVGIMPWTEDLPANPEGPRSYGGFKAVAEAAMLARHRDRRFPASIVRPAAIYGPDNNIFDMETPMFLRLRQHRPIVVPHGGLVTASYGHVDDLCELMVAMTGRPEAMGEVFNVCAEAVTTTRYVEALAAIVGVEPDIVYLPDATLASLDEPAWGHLFSARHHAVLSTAKAERLLGYRWRYDFGPGHEHTYEWFLAQGWGDHDGTDAMVDPVWRASWDFDREAAVAALARDSVTGPHR
jgi:nucleoside-diphosphate-sugar epimerase